MQLSKALTTSILWRGLYFLSVLLLNVLVARHYEAGGSGQIYYITSIFAFVVMLISLCMETPMGYYLSGKKANETQFALLSIGWTLLMLLPVYAAVRFYTSWAVIPFEKSSFILCAMSFLCGNMLIGFFIALFYARLDYIMPNLLLTTVNLVLILLVPNNEFIAGIITTKQYINLYFFGFLAQGLLLTIFFVIKYTRRKQVGFIPAAIIRPFISFTFITLITNAMTFLMYRIDYWFVKKYCTSDYSDMSDLGNYIQVGKIGQLFFILPSILAAVVFPMTASGQKQNINEKMQLLSRCLILFYMIACFILAVTGYWLFPFGSMYVPFLLFIPGILSYSVIHLLAAYYGGKKVLSINFWGNVIALTVIVTGDILVIPSYGIRGAAVVSSTGYVSYMIYMMVAHTKKYGTSFSDFLLFKKTDALMLYKIFNEKFSSQKNAGQ
jgi:O-antigen/teichoic acid export membrane protein